MGTYVQVATGFFHTMLLRSDGQVLTCGQNEEKQLRLPQPPEGVVYVGLASGSMHTLLLASDGNAIACGLNQSRQCNVPVPPRGLRYVSSLWGPILDPDVEPPLRLNHKAELP